MRLRNMLFSVSSEIFPEGKHLMFSYHSSDEIIVAGIRSILEKEDIPVWNGRPSDTTDDMYDRYAF